MKITLPWPDSRLSPNAKRRTHWRVYHPVTKKARQDAHFLTLDAMQTAQLRPDAIPEGKIPIAVTFYPPDRRHRDDDGMVGSFKAARDGIADALHVDDHRFQASYRFEEPEKPGRIEVEISTCSAI